MRPLSLRERVWGEGVNAKPAADIVFVRGQARSYRWFRIRMCGYR